MPLIIITGLPASGKTHRTNELKAFFVEKGKNVRVISENSAIPKAGFRKNEYFDDSKKEKMVRSDLKSEALRLLNKDDVTILDAGNYIKGIARASHFAPLHLQILTCICESQVIAMNCTVPAKQPAPHNARYSVALPKTRDGSSMNVKSWPTRSS